MRFLRLPASSLFLLLCLQVVVPAQLWHELCDHHDSPECAVPQQELTFSKQHVHCLVLELTLPGMLHTEQGFSFSLRYLRPSWITFSTAAEVTLPAERGTVRGPPAAFSGC